jgi:hypothetical protein
MLTTFKPFAFSGVNDAVLLAAAGYVHQFFPATWEDIGGPESGPKLSGHPDTHVWFLTGAASTHEIIVVDGMVVEVQDTPLSPEEAEWAVMTQEDRAAFGGTFDGYLAYTTGHYDEFFSQHHTA